MPGDLNEGLKISLIIPEMSKIGLILSTHTQVQPKHYLTGTLVDLPPVDLHWFFEISIRTEKKIQLVYTDFFSVSL